jgi:hypothetical protein
VTAETVTPWIGGSTMEVPGLVTGNETAGIGGFADDNLPATLRSARKRPAPPATRRTANATSSTTTAAETPPPARPAGWAAPGW